MKKMSLPVTGKKNPRRLSEGGLLFGPFGEGSIIFVLVLEPLGSI